MNKLKTIATDDMTKIVIEIADVTVEYEYFHNSATSILTATASQMQTGSTPVSACSPKYSGVRCLNLRSFNTSFRKAVLTTTDTSTWVVLTEMIIGAQSAGQNKSDLCINVNSSQMSGTLAWLQI